MSTYSNFKPATFYLAIVVALGDTLLNDLAMLLCI